MITQPQALNYRCFEGFMVKADLPRSEIYIVKNDLERILYDIKKDRRDAETYGLIINRDPRTIANLGWAACAALLSNWKNLSIAEITQISRMVGAKPGLPIKKYRTFLVAGKNYYEEHAHWNGKNYNFVSSGIWAGVGGLDYIFMRALGQGFKGEENRGLPMLVIAEKSHEKKVLRLFGKYFGTGKHV